MDFADLYAAIIRPPGRRQPPPRFTSAQEVAEAAAMRDTVRRAAPGGIGYLAAPLANAISDPERRASIGRGAGALARGAVDLGARAIDYVGSGRAGRDIGNVAGAAPGAVEGALRRAPAAAREVARQAPGALHGALRAADQGLRYVADQAPGPLPDLAGGVGVLALRHGPGIVRGLTYGPFEDEERAQQALDLARARGDAPGARSAADEANVNTAFAALNVLAPPVGRGALGFVRGAPRAAQAARPQSMRAADRGGSADLAEAARMGRLAPFSVPGALGGAVLGGALAPQNAQADDGSGGSPLDGLAAVSGGAALGAVFGPRIGRGAGRGRITNRSGAAEGIADETGTSADFARVPTEYAAQSYGRLLDAAEQLARESGGRLPPNYSDALAGLTGYEASGLRPMISKLRSGAYGPELEARARTITGTNGRPNVNRAAIERLMDEGLSREQVHERLNALRAEHGLEPSTLATVGVQMSQIRRARRGDGAGALAGLAAPAALGAGALALTAGDAQAQSSPELEAARAQRSAAQANLAMIDRALAGGNPDDIRALQRLLNEEDDGEIGDRTRAAARARRAELMASLEGADERIGELETAARVQRYSEEPNAFSEIAPYAALGVGGLLGHTPRAIAQTVIPRGLRARTAELNRRLSTDPVNRRTTRTAQAERAGRAANVNAFAQAGGAARTPFEESGRGAFRRRARATETVDLFPGPRTLREGLAARFGGLDATVTSFGAGEAAWGYTQLQGAEQKLREAEAAVRADGESPSEQHLEQLARARRDVETWDLMMRAGAGVALGGAAGAFHSYPRIDPRSRDPRLRPNIRDYEQERFLLNEYLASQPPTPSRRRVP